MPNQRRITATFAVLGLLVFLGIAAQMVAHRRAAAARAESKAEAADFLHPPYLQTGDTPGPDRLALLWVTTRGSESRGAWRVELRNTPGGPWRPTAAPSARPVQVEGVPPFSVHRAALTGLIPGAPFSYRVHQGDRLVFEASARTPAPPGSPQRFVAFGDCAADTPSESSIARQALAARPDYIVVAGDIVYSRGRVSEYNHHYFPVYNANASPGSAGVPLLRSVLTLAAPGNHDLIEANVSKYPDGLAYFYFWDPPQNGPLRVAGAPGAPLLDGTAESRRVFLENAGPAFPRTANFSINLGDVHWVFLDSNTYTNWLDGPLHDWLVADLASPAATSAAWRIAIFHHPPFHASNAHKEDQRTRLIAPMLEQGKVDLVLAGHVHNYQRNRPLRFRPGPPPANGKGKPYGPNGEVDGTFTIDTVFDGKTHTRPDGVVYLVTGAGGAKLYDPAQNDRPDTWKPFTARFVSNTHSLTVVDVTPASLSFRQVSEEGAEVDRFVITR